MKYIFFFLLITLAFSCDRKKATPAGIIPQEKMVGIFIDMHITESKISALNLKRDSTRILFKHYEQEVLNKHNVAKEIYLESFKYYTENVNDMERIYDAVIDSLSLREKILKIE
ncbi:MAG: DUF4296 domain-containing protein [Bacteroidota bacterium]|nr:DUF4296 domain-containing protein [Bacteroidota bacterium]